MNEQHNLVVWATTCVVVTWAMPVSMITSYSVANQRVSVKHLYPCFIIRSYYWNHDVAWSSIIWTHPRHYYLYLWVSMNPRKPHASHASCLSSYTKPVLVIQLRATLSRRLETSQITSSLRRIKCPSLIQQLAFHRRSFARISASERTRRRCRFFIVDLSQA